MPVEDSTNEERTSFWEIYELMPLKTQNDGSPWKAVRANKIHVRSGMDVSFEIAVSDEISDTH